jgi:hypothetical protein
MSKKSNKTSHVLNLLTNRTGLNIEDLEQNTSSDAEDIKNRNLIVPEISVEIQAEATEIKTEQAVEKPVTEKKEVTISDKIRIQLEAIEIQEAAAKAEKEA